MKYIVCYMANRRLVVVDSKLTEEEAIELAKQRSQRTGTEYFVYEQVGTSRRVEHPVEFVKC